MTSHQAAGHRDTDGTREPWHPSRPHAALAADVRWFVASLQAGAFGRLALDQVAYREIAAAVDRTGRFRANFTDRGLRSAAFVAVMLAGDPTDRRNEVGLLKKMHEQVRGQGQGEFADTRYSALSPELWKWVAVSGLNIFYQAYIHVMGRELDAEQRAVVYETLRYITEPLELPSNQARLPATLEEMEEYYDAVAATKLSDNEFLRWAADAFSAPPVPALLVPRSSHRRLVAPLWRILTLLNDRPIAICSAGAAHPRMRTLMGVEWTKRRQVEFDCYTTLLRLTWRHLPRRLTLEPLAYHRYRYEKIRDFYRRLHLESFAP